MNYVIYPASPKALALIDPKAVFVNDTFVNVHHRSKYKFEQLALGQCFVVPVNVGAESSLRQLSVRYGKKLKRKFAVLKHVDDGLIEVARIA